MKTLISEEAAKQKPPAYIKKQSKTCERCGNDQVFGVIHLPATKKYISLCDVCYLGLGDVLKKHRDQIMPVKTITVLKMTVLHTVMAVFQSLLIAVFFYWIWMYLQ